MNRNTIINCSDEIFSLHFDLLSATVKYNTVHSIIELKEPSYKLSLMSYHAGSDPQRGRPGQTGHGPALQPVLR